MSEDDSFVYYDWKQSVVLAVIPQIPAALSLVGSSCIIREVIGDFRRDGGDVIKSILLAMSITDLVSSTAYFLSTWPMPKESATMPFAHGTEFTCTIQGFLVQFVVGAPIYSAIMSLVFLLKIKYGWTEQHVRRVAPFLHGFAITFTLGTAIAGFPLTLYNDNGLSCYIFKYPSDCNETWEYGTTDCIRGDNSTIYLFAFSIVPIWISFAVVLVSMVMLCCFVYKTEANRRRKWSFKFQSSSNSGFGPLPLRTFEGRQWSSLLSFGSGGSQRSKLKKTREATFQALSYIGCFFVVFTPTLIDVLCFFIFGYWSFWIDFFVNLCTPAQGFLNFLVFTRKRKKMHGFLGRSFRYLFFKSSNSTVDNQNRDEDEVWNDDGEGEGDGDNDESEDLDENSDRYEDQNKENYIDGDREQGGKRELEMGNLKDDLGCSGCDDHNGR